MRGQLLKLAFISLVLEFLPIHSLSANDGPIQITTPDLTPGLELNFSALYLRPTGSNLDYAILTNSFSPAPQNWDIQTIKPRFKTGFNIGAGYSLPNSWSDIQLNWSHLRNHRQRSIQADATQYVAPFYQVGPDSFTLKQAFGKAKFSFDVVNLDLGVFMSVCSDLQLRFFGGLTGAEIKQKLYATFNDPSPNFFLTQKNVSKFTGLGPRLGFGGGYEFIDCFNIVGHMAGSLLIGNQRQQARFYSQSNDLSAAGIFQNKQGIRSHSAHQVVPALDARLGLNYSFAIANNSLFTVEAGYQAYTFINALLSYNPQSVGAPIQAGTVPIATMVKSQSNFSVDGPYLNFKLGF